MSQILIMALLTSLAAAQTADNETVVYTFPLTKLTDGSGFYTARVKVGSLQQNIDLVLSTI